MEIKKAEYIASAVYPEQYPEEILPEIAMLGRSNVGKSSLINSLSNRKNLARTSSQPGKTRLINFYKMDRSWYLVDLPGYGYAKVSQSSRDDWKKMIEKYLACNPENKFYFQLVDIRHEPSALDKQMNGWLEEKDFPYVVIATKLDKISRGAREKQLALISKTLGVERERIFPFSAQTKEGKEAILSLIGKLLGIEEPETEAVSSEKEA
ncbi:MAG: YihA family ribosome biogenesis GTP-binding protein [Peptococcaceae bacterium]|nr:YihA family ribosome biogenesis GTP-binding protein [Peptococcaceae bacterium]